ncbi:phosphoglycolate phosphatase [Psychromonas sp. psych-6C06]|uniref:phosphoglycolate phosphatase n=1 Tax=Psychromonas sp. psych-6C06 TaxID=2058089 RepID=UPI000C329D22|nr:phosphoglycolate phosphatase [Psychromonas sp. psych-6C06]PKF61489.1 phosphoglycolate phosphatase [Psychromonas sp. psych-6C06]
MAKIENIKLICFDLDGTLVDSVPDLRLALNAMMDDFQLPHCQDEQIKTWVGNGLPKLVERALLHVGNQTVSQSQALSCFETHYQHYLNSASCLYPEVADTLRALKARGYQTALITNKAEQFLPELLQHFEISDCFDLLLGGDTLAKNKPDPMQVDFALAHFNVQKSQAVMVGDSKNDILAGQNAGLISIVLTYGYNYGEPVSLLNPDYIIDQFNDLLVLL